MPDKSESPATRWSALLPDAELLKQWQGVEEGLRRRRTLSRIGWAGAVAAAALQVAVAVLDSKWLQAIKNLDLSVLKDSWYLALPLIVAVVFFILYRWSRFWLRESEQPFRYTCSIEEFTPSGGSATEPKLKWLSHHLSRKMNERIGRLRFAEEPKAGGDESSSHISVRGHYIIRIDRDGNPLVEVLTRVRIGGSSRPETLGHPVLFSLLPRPPDTSSDVAPARVAAAETAAGEVSYLSVKEEASYLSVKDYELLLERVYFSAASEIYRQIREDVSKKIDLLPTRRFKAVALFHEAEDYARSGTLDAYQEARTLYERCARLLDPALEPLPEHWLRRRVAHLLCRFRIARHWLRQVESHLRPALAREDLLCARAELGYAIVLLQHYVISFISGRRVGAVFEVPAVARRAIRRLKATSLDVPERRATLFRAYVVSAWACQALDDQGAARHWLRDARELAPAAADEDMLYNLVGGFLSMGLMQRIETLQRAYELQPDFETAAFSLAIAKEHLWRSRSGLDRRVANEVIKLYGQLVTTNPGLVGAWANSGYLQWLIAAPDTFTEDLECAKLQFLTGRRYKEIKQETFVAELDYGLARIAAERGDFATAYLHCADLASSMFSSGLYFTAYYFDYIGPHIVGRFEQYRKNVEEWHCLFTLGAAADQLRMCNSVLAFVLNDCGDAYQSSYQRTGDKRHLGEARKAYDRAAELDPEFSVPYLNLARLYGSEGSAARHKAAQHLERCLELSPKWPDAILEMAALQGSLIRELDTEARNEKKEAEDKKKKAKEKLDEVAKLAAAAILKRQRALKLELRGAREHTRASSAEQAKQLLPTKTSQSSEKLESFAERAEAENDERKSDDLQKEADELFKQAERHSETAEDKHKKAVEAERTAREFAQKLLPHDWVWRDSATEREREFDWRLLRRADIEAELRWEREFTVLNAHALRTYAEALVMHRAEDSSENQTSEPSDLLAFVRKQFRLVMRPAVAGNENQPRKHSDLLAFVRKHFWPTHVSSMLTLRHANRMLGADDTDALRTLIKGWLASDPANFSSLRWVTDEVIPNATQTQILLDSVERNDLSPVAYAWIADHLAKKQPESAQAACRRALVSDDGQTLGAVARCCERLKGWDDALAAWDKILAAQPAAAGEQTDAAVGRAVALWMKNEHESALSVLRQVAHDHPSAGEWRGDFTSRVDLSQADTLVRRLLRCWLESQQNSPNVEARTDAIDALLRLASSQTAALSPPDQAGQPLLAITAPVVLEGEAGLFPGDTADELLARLPQMRDRIIATLGARLPGVRVRANGDLPANAYVVSLEEVAIAEGKAYPDRLVCPDWPHDTSVDAEFKRVFNPLTGAVDAVVVPLSQREALAARGCELWDHWEYMSRHLEAVLRSNVSQFFGLQEVQNTLEVWLGAVKSEDETKRRKDLVARAVPDIAARVALVDALRALLQEQVSIADLGPLLEEFTAHYARGTDASLLAEALRWRVRQQLSVRADAAFVHLSPALEDLLRDALVVSGGKTWSAVEPATDDGLLQDIDGAIEGLRCPALVVRDRRVRALLRRTTSSVYPHIPVFALRELPRELRSRRAATVEPRVLRSRRVATAELP